MGKKRKKSATDLDHLMLYEASVQNVEEAVPFVQRLFKENRRRSPRLLREDFCGSSAFLCEWVRSHRKNTAVGIDLDRETLEWAAANNLSTLGKDAERVELQCDDVRNRSKNPVDVICAFNFSYNIFKRRKELKEYLRAVYESLVEDGVFMCDMFGGTEGMNTTCEVRTICKRTRPDGTKVPSFKYYWEHEHFNVINHDILCHIHFKLKGQPRMEKVFTYDWRLWTLPELSDLLEEVGFSSVKVYLHGWTPEGESDEEYKRTEVFENAEGWLAYIVALK